MTRRWWAASPTLALVWLASCGRVGFDGIGTGPADPDASTDAMAACTVRLGAGRQHTTAIFSDGPLHVWGYGTYGQIGDGLMLDRASPIPVVLPVRTVSASGGRYETAARGSAARCGAGVATTAVSSAMA